MTPKEFLFTKVYHINFAPAISVVILGNTIAAIINTLFPLYVSFLVSVITGWVYVRAIFVLYNTNKKLTGTKIRKSWTEDEL